MKARGWIGVDLDGTLAKYETWRSPSQIGEPVPEMLERVKDWIADGVKVKIVTARRSMVQSIPFIKLWLEQAGLPDLEITDRIDFEMLALWSDRCVQVEANTGKLLNGGH